MTRKVLGRGIKALLSEDVSFLKEEKFVEIDIDLIHPNPNQPRKNFSEESMRELVESIKEAGIIQPILVTPEENGYKIVVGERRWRAAQVLGLTKIPAVIKNIEPAKQLELALIENLQREDLNPIEVATGYQRLIEIGNLTHEELAQKVGKDRSSVTNYLRLLKLPQEIKDLIAEGRIEMGHARTLLSVEDPLIQKQLAKLVYEKELSVRELERIIKKGAGKKSKEKTVYMPIIEEDLRKILGTKVRLMKRGKGGYLLIRFHSEEELERLYKIIKGGN
ncbi:MAG: ParB/RepB/Spo0J family partition protein [Candidatus Aminicenantia bacterium]